MTKGEDDWHDPHFVELMRAPAPSPWNETTIGRLRVLMDVRPALSFTEIADRLNVEFNIHVTKNSCISRSRREGIPKARAVDKPRKAPKPRLPSRPPPADNEPGTILDLGTYDCRWIINDKPAEALYCRGRQIEGCSYCATHAQKAFPAMGRH